MIAIDARGMRCPWPALRLARAMREGDEVTILADDPAASGEISALAQAHGWTLQEYDGHFHVFRGTHRHCLNQIGAQQ